MATHRQTMFELEAKFPDVFHRTRANRFRSQSDFSTATSLYPHYAVMVGQGLPSGIGYRYFETTQLMLAPKLLRLQSETDTQRPQVFCLNAIGNKSVGRINHWAQRAFLHPLFPSSQPDVPLNRPSDKLRRGITQVSVAVLRLLWRGVRKVTGQG